MPQVTKGGMGGFLNGKESVRPDEGACDGARKRSLRSYCANPRTAAAYLGRALRKDHDVLTCGPDIAGHGAIVEDRIEPIWKVWNLEAVKDRVRAHDVSSLVLDAQALEAARAVRPGWEPDLFLWVDTAIYYPLDGMNRLACPKAAYFIDSHNELERHLEMAPLFDVVFVAQRAYIPAFRRAGHPSVHWLPLACDPDVHAKHALPKVHDIGFVGTINGDLNPRRVEMIELLKRHFPVHVERCFLEDMARVFSQSRIVLNQCVKNDLNMRVFEALSCGSMLLTDEADGLTEFFEDRKHLVVYRNEKELVDLARRYLDHPEEREGIAAAGRAEVLARHTYGHRAGKILSVVEEAAPAPSGRRPRADAPGDGYPSKDMASRLPDYYSQERPEILSLVPADAASILDVGCGEGALGASLLRRGAKRVVGIEREPRAAAIARSRLTSVIEGDVEALVLPFDDGAFDCIVCADVLEHLIDPWMMLRKLSRLLRPGGTFVASIPNIRNIEILARLVEGRWTYEDAGLLDKGHLRFFAKADIEDMLKQAGFSVRFGGQSVCPLFLQFKDRPFDGTIQVGRLRIEGLSLEEFRDLFVVQYMIQAGKTALVAGGSDAGRCAATSRPEPNLRERREVIAMPTSTYEHIRTFVQFLITLRPSSVLDIGVGNGKMGFIARDLLDVMIGERHRRQDWKVRLDGIEVFQDYIQDHQRAIYDHIYIGDAFKVIDGLGCYDLIVLGDVLEHFEKSQAWEFLDKCAAHAQKSLIINMPLGERWVQGPIYGNPWEEHRSFWRYEDLEPFVADKAFFDFPQCGRYGCVLVQTEDYQKYRAGQKAKSAATGIRAWNAGSEHPERNDASGLASRSCASVPEKDTAREASRAREKARIAFFCDHTAGTGGGERYLLTMADTLSRRYEVDLFVRDERLLPNAKHVREALGLDWPAERIRGKVLRDMAEIEPYDLFINASHFQIHPPVARRNLLFTFFPQYGRPDLARRYDRVLTISRFCQEWVRRNWGMGSGLLYPCVEDPRLTPGGKTDRIVSVGRFFEAKDGNNKNHRAMIEAFRRICDAGTPGWELVLAGATDPSQTAYVEELRRLSAGYPIRILTDVPYEELRDVYRAARVYWHAAGLGATAPSGMEHFGITIVEAMRAGAVPVVFGGGGPAEIVSHGESGLIFKDADELVLLTAGLIRDLSRMEEMAKEAQTSSRRFGREAFDLGLMEVVEGVLSPDRLQEAVSRARRGGDAEESSFLEDLADRPDAGFDLFLELGDARYRMGRREMARAAWARAVDLEPDHALAPCLRELTARIDEQRRERSRIASGRLFDGAYFEDGRARGVSDYENYNATWAEGHAKTLWDVFRPGSCLEIGCAKGDMVASLRRMGVRAFGMDVSAYSVGQAAGEAAPYLHVGSAAALPFSDASFDLVAGIEVLEHVPEEAVPATLAEIRRVCRGAVFLTVANTTATQPHDFFKDISHVTMKPLGWWQDRMREAGFGLVDGELPIGEFLGHQLVARVVPPAAADITPAESSADDPVKALCADAAEALKSGDADGARRLFERAASLNGHTAEPYLGLGAVAIYESSYVEARQWYEKAVKLAGEDPRSLFGLGLAHWGGGEKETALDCFVRAASRDADNPALVYHLVQAAHAAGKLETAVEPLERYLDLHPADSDFLLSYAGVCARLGRRSNAEEALSRLRLIAPDQDGLKDLEKTLEETAGCRE